MIYIIDHQDSFTWNVVHQFSQFDKVHCSDYFDINKKLLNKSDVIVLVAPIWNFRMPAIVEGWIDKVLSPPWAFTFKKLVGNYGYPMGNLKDKKAILDSLPVIFLCIFEASNAIVSAFCGS